MVKAMRNHPILLTFLVATVIAVGLVLVTAPSADSQESSRQSCDPFGGPLFCLEKSVEDPVTVGEQVTFTITAFCERAPCAGVSPGVEDNLPAGVEFVSAEARGVIPADCVESGGTVTCSPESFDRDTPFVAEIIVIPTRCGTFTNTARELFRPALEPQTVSLPFTVVGCDEEEAPAPAPITQEGEQESESGEIDQTFEVS